MRNPASQSAVPAAIWALCFRAASNSDREEQMMKAKRPDHQSRKSVTSEILGEEAKTFGRRFSRITADMNRRKSAVICVPKALAPACPG